MQCCGNSRSHASCRDLRYEAVILFQVQLQEQLGLLLRKTDKNNSNSIQPSLSPAGSAAKFGEERLAMQHGRVVILKQACIQGNVHVVANQDGSLGVASVVQVLFSTRMQCRGNAVYACREAMQTRANIMEELVLVVCFMRHFERCHCKSQAEWKILEIDSQLLQAVMQPHQCCNLRCIARAINRQSVE